MPTCSGHPYLLEESSEYHITPMDLQQIVVMFAEINVKLDTLKTVEERLTKVAMHEPPESPTWDQTPARNNRHKNTDNSLMLNIWKASRSMSQLWWTSRLTTFHKLDTLIR